jgi:integrase
MTTSQNEPDDQTLTIIQPVPVITTLAELGQAAEQDARGIDHLEQHKRKRSPQTRRRYRFDLAHFEAFLQSAANTTGTRLELDLLNNLQAWQGITPELLMAYQQAMEDEGLATGTISLRVYTVKALCRVAFNAHLLDADTYGRIRLVEPLRPAEADNLDANRRAAGLPTRKPQGKNAKKAAWTPLSVAQIKTLLKACGPDRRGTRDRLLILLAFRLGLRVGEIALLKLSSLDLEAGILTLDRPKTHLKEQRLELPEELQGAARAWLSIRLQEISDPGAPLFNAERKPGQAINEGTISHRIAHLARVHLGLEHVSSHDGRHYWIDDALANQVDVKTFTEAGGWKTPVVPLRIYASKARIANQNMRGTSLAIES